MSKRFISFFVAFILCVSSLCVFASADGYGDNNTTVKDTLSDEVDWLESGTYKIENGFVFVDGAVTAEKFIHNFTNPSKVTVSNKAGSVTGSKAVATGDTVRYDGTEEKDEATVVIRGDVDCNGKATVTDIIKVRSHILKTSIIKLGTAEFAAADFDDNNVLSVTDITSLVAVVLNS